MPRLRGYTLRCCSAGWVPPASPKTSRKVAGLLPGLRERWASRASNSSVSPAAESIGLAGNSVLDLPLKAIHHFLPAVQDGLLAAVCSRDGYQKRLQRLLFQAGAQALQEHMGVAGTAPLCRPSQDGLEGSARP